MPDLSINNLIMHGLSEEAMMSTLQKAGNAMAEATNQQMSEVKKQYPDLSDDAVMDVTYLRTRSRHTEALEARLIKSHREGKTVMISDWPYHEDGNYDPLTGKPL